MRNVVYVCMYMCAASHIKCHGGGIHQPFLFDFLVFHQGWMIHNWTYMVLVIWGWRLELLRNSSFLGCLPTRLLYEIHSLGCSKWSSSSQPSGVPRLLTLKHWWPLCCSVISSLPECICKLLHRETGRLTDPCTTSISICHRHLLTSGTHH